MIGNAVLDDRCMAQAGVDNTPGCLLCLGRKVCLHGFDIRLSVVALDPNPACSDMTAGS